MAFKASKAKSGLFEIHGLESFIEKKFAELKKAFGVETAVPAKTAAPRARKAAAPAKKTASVKVDPLAQVLANLDAHPKKANLIKAGKQKDQLLRSLIPLYVARGTVEVSSGITSKFWAKHGIKFAAPNAAKALREHKGYATRSKAGTAISSNGVKYVEEALKK